MQAKEEKLSSDIIEKKVKEISEFRGQQEDILIKNILLETVSGYKIIE